MTALPYVVAAWLFVAGLYGVVTSRNLIHQIICLSVVQALCLTDVVVGATVSALLLAIAVQVHKHTGTLDPENLREQLLE